MSEYIKRQDVYEMLLDVNKDEYLKVRKWKVPSGKKAINFERCDIKDGIVLEGAYGIGSTFEQAYDNYLDKLDYRKLVFDSCKESRKEIDFTKDQINHIEGRLKIEEAIRRLEKIPTENAIEEEARVKKEKNTGYLNTLAKEAYQNAVNHGWYDPEPSFPEAVMMMVTELSEAVAKYRDDCEPCYYLDGDGNISTDMTAYKGQELHGTAVELIDCLLRILSYCGGTNIDIDDIIRKKMTYNKFRPYRHGGKKI